MLQDQEHAYVELWDESGRALSITALPSGEAVVVLDGCDFMLTRGAVIVVQRLLQSGRLLGGSDELSEGIRGCAQQGAGYGCGSKCSCQTNRQSQ